MITTKLSHLFLAKVDSERQLEGTEHRREVLCLRIMDQLSHTIIHERVKKCQVMPADLPAKEILQHVTVKVKWTDLVL